MASVEPIDVNQVMRTVPVTLTVRLTGVHWLAFRLRLVTVICRVAAAIIGCKWEVRPE